MLLYVAAHTDFHIFMMVVQTLVLAYPMYNLLNRLILQRIGMQKTGPKVAVSMSLTIVVSIALYMAISIGVAALSQ